MSTHEVKRPGISAEWVTIIGSALSLIITVVILGTKVIDKVDGISTKVESISIRQDKTDEKINVISGRIDTLQNRQLQYHYENLIREAKK